MIAAAATWMKVGHTARPLEGCPSSGTSASFVQVVVVVTSRSKSSKGGTSSVSFRKGCVPFQSIEMEKLASNSHAPYVIEVVDNGCKRQHHHNTRAAIFHDESERNPVLP